MKKQLILSLSLFSLLTVTLLNCGKKKEDPTPGGNNTGGNNTSLAISAVNPTSGTAGTKVVITGTGFSATLSANTVKFGSMAVILDSASTTRLVTKVPKDATTGKITVEAGGKTATSSSDFSITQAPPTFSGTGSTVNVPVTVTTTTASIATTIDKEGSKSIIQHGHIWSSTKSEPTLRGAATEGKTELGAVPANATFPYKFTSDLKDLDPSTTYNVRAYVKTGEGTTYGPVSQVQSKKPCTLSTISTPNATTSFTFNNRHQLTAIKDNLQTSSFTYNADGFLTQFESKRDGSTVTETYEYLQGKLNKKETKRDLGTLTINTLINYEYDAQGQLSKEIYTSGTTKIDYIFTQGILNEVKSSVATSKYTVKDGNIVKIENTGSTINYEYDTNRNRTKSETITNGNTSSFQYKFDDKPNFKMALYGSLKGWSPYQLTTSEFYGSTTISGSGYNNMTESVYQYTDTAGQLAVNTQRYIYTYSKNRTLGYSNSFAQTVGGKITANNPAVNYTLNYSGDCEN